ncbi:MAG: amidohydrolase family protein [Solobacterium sp.]|nr:amidohydrolase family protein [Solobacterium sp.]
MSTTVIKGTVITAKSRHELSVLEHAEIVTEDGIIQEVAQHRSEPYQHLPVTDLEDAIIIPSFSDLHIHAPQYTERGVGMDCLLFDWLNNYTFPQEAKFQDVRYAKTIYAQLIRDLLRHGTTQANFFTTIHYDSCDLFFHMLEESGMYAFTGKINMDRNSPDYYVEDTETSIHETERFLQEHQNSDHVKPMIIPRFAPTCTKELLEGLGNLAKTTNAGLHTHLVESIGEAAWSKELFPECASDGEIYERTGLLNVSGPKIFAHVIFPTETEDRIFEQYHAVAVHCPDATANITAGIMPVSRLLDQKYHIAEGTDIGGGHSPAVYRSISHSVQLSKLKEFYEPENHRLSFAEAFWMATANGGEVFGNIGKIEPGYRFNALILRPMQDEGFQISPLEALERFCYIGDDRDILERYIDGIKVDPEGIYQKLIRM